ncbi:MAG: transporter substrate-binding domain-containing protein [Paraglaciecola sp.]|uniref:substrate-binding periplasmic protein n=1 Tax=Paraglaciecola sp. TaxID=1920173 RepID=UPI0032990D53
MNSVMKSCFVFLILLVQDLKAKELVLVAGLAKPPYVIPEQDSGFEVDLMRDVLGKLGHNISMLYVPYGRTYETMKQVNADIGLTQSEKGGVKAEILSLPYVTYQNVAVSLKDKSIKLGEFQDLQPLVIVAFQNANRVLGSAFAKATKQRPLYLELPEQRRQVELLLTGRADVAVLDINIFKYFAKLITGVSQMEKMQVHNLFTSTRYGAAIHDPKLRKAFNRELLNYFDTPEYDSLLQKYDMKYSDGYHFYNDSLPR